jgi:hypothetical protein
MAWLNSGAEPTPEPPAAPAPAPPSKPPAAPPATQPAKQQEQAPPAQSCFARAQQAISEAKTVKRIEFLHGLSLKYEMEGELTADEMLELSTLCESMRVDIELANSNNGELQPI